MNALFKVSEVAASLTGAILQGTGEELLYGVATDSREVKSGDLFVALKGARVDGHDFLLDAQRRGAAGALIMETGKVPSGTSMALIKVADTLRSLGDLAATYRQRFQIPVIGVTGSVGKTTTKDMIKSVLQQRYRTLATVGNYNTEVGLPLTIFNLRPEHEALVLEMGMRGRGEIARLVEIARPSIGVITEVTETHLERLGTLENIAAAKAELIMGLPPDGLAVLNSDNHWVRQMAGLFPGRKVFYGFAPEADVRAVEIKQEDAGMGFQVITGEGHWRVSIPVPGRHNVRNALAAVAVGLEMGLTMEAISEGLRALELTEMRLQTLHYPGLSIISDVYNASPTSTSAALEILRDISGSKRRVAILGDMLELSSYALEGHRLVGVKAVETGVNLLLTVGELAKNIAEAALEAGMPAEDVYSYSETKDLIDNLAGIIKPGDVILVKGSRGMRMEEIVDALSSLAKGLA